MNETKLSSGLAERLFSLKNAARALGIPYFKILAAANAGIFPTYTLMNTRRLVRLSEVIAVIEASRSGGH